AEQRLAGSFMRATDLAGEVVTLGDPGDPVVALYRLHQLPEARGGVILLHDSRANANSHEVIRPLRLRLADAGWHTLSVQLAVAYDGSGTALDVTRQRLAAAIAWFRQRDVLNLAVIADGDSAVAALDSVSNDKPDEVRAVVIIGSALGDARDEAIQTAFTALEVPLLDVVAQHDRPDVLTGAEVRREWARKTQQDFRQRVVDAAYPGYSATTDSLVVTVRAWLAKRIAGVEVRR
ncbi:MAG: DUF3530 family protein, partial [Gammaproteobacteria bacterium]|nr:DUF3530 family protein [Gammaproteobacteria bacterium]